MSVDSLVPIGCELIIEERQTDKTAVAIRRRSMIPPSTGTVATINSVVAKRSSIEDLVLMHEDQIAEMVLIWSSFYTKVLSLPIFCYHLLVVDRHKLTVFHPKRFDMDSVLAYFVESVIVLSVVVD